MSDRSGPSGWRRGLAARFTALAGVLLAGLAAVVIAASAYGARSAATARAAEAAVAAVAEAGDALAGGRDPAETLTALRARPGVAYAYLTARDGALIAGERPAAEAARSSELKRLDPPAGVTVGDGAAVAVRTVALPNAGRGVLYVAQTLDDASQAARVVAGGLLAALAFLALALPVVAILVDRTVDPLRVLARALSRPERGGDALDAAARRDDEIGALARAHIDITRRLSQNDDVVRRLTFDDPLTALPNKAALRRRLVGALQVGEPVALLKIGVAGLGRVATGLGHAANDAAVLSVADRLRATATEWVRGAPTAGMLCNDRTIFVARTGEAEFALLVERAEPDVGDELARLALRSFEAPLLVDDHPVALGVSVGVALAPLHGDEADALLRSAAAALASAWVGGPQTVRHAGVDLNDNAYGRLRIEQELRRAIPAGELEVHYQPQIDLRSGRVIGAEALVRWRHPTRGLVPPDKFIPVAEETGLVEPLGRFVLEQASRKAAAWAAMGLDQRIAVNVSALQFRNPRFAETVLGVVRGAGCDPNLIELEITESMAMADAGHAARELGPLRAAGVRIAIDDFGTGYSNLASLTQLPFDVLKIDRGFVRDALEKPNARVVVAAVLGLAANLGVETVAEGVETEDQRQFVASHGCTFGQGYLWAKPMPADAFEAWRLARLTADLRALHGRAAAADASEAVRATRPSAAG